MGLIEIPWAKPEIGNEELNEVVKSFKSNWLTMGPKVKEIEQQLAAFLKVPYAIAVSNGTVALDIALKTLGIGPNDEVIVPAMTYFATASAVSYQNAIPVFVDIDRTSLNLDPNRLIEAITNKTKAIIFIDYGGNPSNYDEIAKVGKEHGIHVLQDGAQSLGAIYKGEPMGAQTEISTMSFHMAKIMATIEGGMIFTHNEVWYEELLSRRNQGEQSGGKYKHVVLGTNARMTDLQASIGLAQFKKLPDLIAKRRRVAQRYNEYFVDFQDKIETVSTVYENSQNVYFLYPVLIGNRDSVAVSLLEKKGIDTRICYPMPVYMQEVFASGKLKYRKLDCPVAEEVTSKILNLPIYPSMKDEMINKVVHALLTEINGYSSTF